MSSATKATNIKTKRCDGCVGASSERFYLLSKAAKLARTSKQSKTSSRADAAIATCTNAFASREKACEMRATRTRFRLAQLAAALDANDFVALGRVAGATARHYLRADAISRPGALVSAILKGHSHSVAWLISVGASLCSRAVDGGSEIASAVAACELGTSTTPLHIAALLGDTETGEALIAAGADVNQVDDAGCPALFAALTADFARLLLANGARADIRGTRGNSVLHAACVFDAAEVVELTIKAGADVHAVDVAGLSVLHACASENAARCASLLLQAGAQADRRNSHGQTALDVAFYEGRARPIACLLESEAAARKITMEELATCCLYRLVRAIPVPCYLRKTPSLLAFDPTNDHLWSDARDRVACLRALCGAGARADVRDNEAYSPLDRALRNASMDVEVVIELLQRGVDYDHGVSHNGETLTPFGLALTPETTPAFADAFLAMPGVSPDSIVNLSTGQTALMYALEVDASKDHALVRRLLASAPSLCLEDLRGRSVWSQVYTAGRGWPSLLAEWASASVAALSCSSAMTTSLWSPSLPFDAFAQGRSSLAGQDTTALLIQFLPKAVLQLVAEFAGTMRGNLWSRLAWLTRVSF